MTAKEYEQIILSLTIDSKKFSTAEATLYLLQLATRQEPTPSVRQLAETFGWGHDKVHRFLKSDKNRTLVRTANRTTFPHAVSELQVSVGQQIGQQIGQKSDTLSPSSEAMLVRTKQYLSLSWSQQQLERLTPQLACQAAEFYRSLMPFASKYPPEMLKDFFLYWTAPNSSVTRMLFQLQRTWAVGSRLATWSKREKQTTQHYDQQQRIDTNRRNAVQAMRDIAAADHFGISDAEKHF